MEITNPKVFVSYCWTNPEHESFVIGLAEDLVGSGVDIIIDKWNLRDGQDSISFMESMINDKTIKKVLIISDKGYADKANNRAGGVGTEAQIISPEVYASATQTKFVVVTTEKDPEGRHYVPTFYKGRLFIDMSDANNYTDGFDKVLRWVYDRPVYEKPEIGKRPSFLDEPQKTSLGTSSFCARAVDAIRGGKTTVLGYFDEYLSTLAVNLERLRLQVEDANAEDEAFLKNIESFIPERNEFINLVNLVCRFNLGKDFSKRLHAFFQDALAYYYTPELVNSYRETDYDNYKFIIGELYIYTIASYLKYERFDECVILFGKYYVPLKARFGDSPLTSFTVINQNIGILDWRNRTRNLGRTSLHSDLLKERCHGVPLTFNEIHQADFLCYIKAMAITDEPYSYWWPSTLLYSKGRYAFEIFAKASEPRYFHRIQGLLGFLTGHEFLSFINEVENSGRVPKWGFDRMSPLRLSNAEAIAENN
ncbi:TIR domain-containing protein [Pantoea sp. PNT02]|uniref:SEFIR domain-containing protein n=1 Tax=Pantoea sp. PNT02 TaxID=2769261 RepID=UPI001780617A|nr:SEFIR domain-containing protein [Pantoea sp. PNT02]MBD9643661.1 TIR domain-containing protein [Pantoea sp. PNT02]